jgi:hypothetical protein
MKKWLLFGSTMVAVAGVTACSASATIPLGTGGQSNTTSGTHSTVVTSGSTTTTHTGTTTATTGTTTTTTTTSGASGSCSAPSAIADCGTCAKQSDCETCASMLDQSGVQPYNDLLDCVFCTGCYTTCQSASVAGACTGAPATKDACDTGTPGTTACQACQQCSTKSAGTCGAKFTACNGSTQCVDLLKNLYNTCHPLPM